MARKLISFLVWFVAIGAANSANILFFAPFGTHSTRISKWPLMEALSEKGHTVVYLSSLKNFEVDPKKSKITTYEPKLLAKMMEGWDDGMDIYQMRGEQSGNLAAWPEFLPIGVEACKTLYDDKEFLEWVKASKFDLVVSEAFMNECALGLAYYWKAKWAMYCTSYNTPWFPDAFGLPDETSSMPEMMTGYQAGEMTFTERFSNALVPIYVHMLRKYTFLPALEAITRKGLGEAVRDMPSFSELERNVTIVFVSQHFSFEFPHAYPPNFIPVGGNVISKKLKPIPEEMDKFINSGKKGFIYVSFGTVVQFTTFPKEIQIEFIKALGQFPDIRFVWKSTHPITVTKIPDNVFMTTWAPQQSLLAHPKVLGYIAHGGMGSLAEAIHFSVPLIVVPLLWDQQSNAEGIVAKEAGVFVEIVDLKQRHLEEAIREIIHNKKYREGMSALTKVFKDRPIPTMDNAVWWTEYVLRHDNVQKFISHPSRLQPWWVRRQIDVWITATLLLLIAILLPLYITYIIAKKCLGGGDNRKRKVKKN